METIKHHGDVLKGNELIWCMTLLKLMPKFWLLLGLSFKNLIKLDNNVIFKNEVEHYCIFISLKIT